MEDNHVLVELKRASCLELNASSHLRILIHNFAAWLRLQQVLDWLEGGVVKDLGVADQVRGVVLFVELEVDRLQPAMELQQNSFFVQVPQVRLVLLAEQEHQVVGQLRRIQNFLVVIWLVRNLELQLSRHVFLRWLQRRHFHA